MRTNRQQRQLADAARWLHEDAFYEICRLEHTGGDGEAVKQRLRSIASYLVTGKLSQSSWAEDARKVTATVLTEIGGQRVFASKDSDTSCIYFGDVDSANTYAGCTGDVCDEWVIDDERLPTALHPRTVSDVYELLRKVSIHLAIPVSSSHSMAIGNELIEWERDQTTRVTHEATTPIGVFKITEPYESIHLYEVQHNGRNIAGLETLEECYQCVRDVIHCMAAFLRAAT